MYRRNMPGTGKTKVSAQNIQPSMEKNLPWHKSITWATSLFALTGVFAIKSDYCYQQEADLAVLLQGESSKLQISQNTRSVILTHTDGMFWSLFLSCVWGGFCDLTQLKLRMQVTNTRFPEQGHIDIPKSWRTKGNSKGNQGFVLGARIHTPQVPPGEKSFALCIL